jgi:hypothetical protein
MQGNVISLSRSASCNNDTSSQVYEIDQKYFKTDYNEELGRRVVGDIVAACSKDELAFPKIITSIKRPFEYQDKFYVVVAILGVVSAQAYELIPLSPEELSHSLPEKPIYGRYDGMLVKYDEHVFKISNNRITFYAQTVPAVHENEQSIMNSEDNLISINEVNTDKERQDRESELKTNEFEEHNELLKSSEGIDDESNTDLLEEDKTSNTNSNDQYDYNKCIVNIGIQLLPVDQQLSDRAVIIGINSGDELPIVKVLRESDLGVMPEPIKSLIAEFKQELPTRKTVHEARIKAEEDKKRAEEERRKAITNKTNKNKTGTKTSNLKKYIPPSNSRTSEDESTIFSEQPSLVSNDVVENQVNKSTAEDEDNSSDKHVTSVSNSQLDSVNISTNNKTSMMRKKEETSSNSSSLQGSLF